MDQNNLKFNIGLPLSANPKDFRCFLKEYHQHIESIYFSLPLGIQHHTRQKISNFFAKEKNVAKFWELLRIIKEFPIELELLLNSYALSGEDVAKAAALLKEHNVDIDAVCPLDHLYEDTVRCFPGKKLIYSYNNGIRTVADFDNAAKAHHYDYYVIGSSAIRNNELFKHIQEQGKKVILLVNNGCSYNCGWCRENGSCMKTFKHNLKTHSAEHLYALQTILPNELHDGTVDLSAVDLLKFSNRTSPLRYTKNGLDSYISGQMLRYIRRSRMNYSLYARMQGFWRHFLFLNLKKIRKYKEEILGHPVTFK